MRHALALLLLLLRHAPAQRCTSLAGPDCEIINGRAPARPPTDEITKAKPSSWRERLLGVVRAHLEEGRDRADAVKGAFEVRGDLPDAGGAFELVAGAWLDQPEGWITVGLRGRFEDNCTLSGEITDGEGDEGTTPGSSGSSASSAVGVTASGGSRGHLPGADVEVLMSTVPNWDEDGQVCGIVCFLQDCTEIKRLQREANEHAMEQVRMRAIEENLAVTFHELRNPLSTIQINAELLAEDLLEHGLGESSEPQETLRNVIAEVERLEATLDAGDAWPQDDVRGGWLITEKDGPVLVHGPNADVVVAALRNGGVPSRVQGDFPKRVAPGAALVLLGPDMESWPKDRPRLLQSWVRDEGVDLVMTGGPSGLGADGDWMDPLDRTLPLAFPRKKKRQPPPLAVQLSTHLPWPVQCNAEKKSLLQAEAGNDTELQRIVVRSLQPGPAARATRNTQHLRVGAVGRIRDDLAAS